MEQKVLEFIAQNQLIKKNTHVLVGVSGGPDSLALLHFLHRHRTLWNIQVHAVTIDHQLRGEASLEDVHYVEKLCEQLNIPCISRQVDVATYKRDEQIGTQMAARTLRYEAFSEEMI